MSGSLRGGGGGGGSGLGWLPLVHSSHLSLPQFANLYSTTTVQLPSEPSHGQSTQTQTQILVATVDTLYALHTNSGATGGGGAHSGGLLRAASVPQHSRASSQPRSKSSTNLAAQASAAAAANAVAAQFAAGSSSSSSALCTPLSSLEPLPLRGLGDGGMGGGGGGVEIIAVDAFNVGRDNRPVICVAAGVIAPGGGGGGKSHAGTASSAGVPSKFVLNIYGLHCGLTSDLHTIAQDCVSIRLGFVPFVLTHSSLLLADAASSPQQHAVDILLSGSDKSVHVYRWSSLTRSYAEVPFSCPSHPLLHLHGTPSAVLSLDVACSAASTSASESTERGRRHRSRRGWTYMVAGCQDGLVRVATVRAAAAPAAPSAPSRSKHAPPRAEEEAAVSPWQLGDDEGDNHPTAAASSFDAAVAAANSDSGSEGDDNDGEEGGSASSEFRCSDFHLDGPVSSARFFSPSTFLSDVFRDARPWSSEQHLEDNALNRMQRRAFKACQQERRSRIEARGRDNEGEEEEEEEEMEEEEDEEDGDRRSKRRGGSRSSRAPQPEVRLLLSNAIGFGAVFGSLDPWGVSFESSWYLNGSGCYAASSSCSSPRGGDNNFLLQLVDPATDSVLCATPADLNMDGRCEMMLGTYSAQMIVFQETNDGARNSNGDEDDQRTSRIDAPNGYQLATNKQFAHPIYSLMSVDVSGSGVCDLVVTSLFSVDVLSWEVDSAMQLMHNKMQCMDEIRMLEQAMEDMQKQTQQQQQQQQQPQQQPQQPSSTASPIRAS